VALGDLGVVLLAQLPALAELEIPWCLKVTNAGGFEHYIVRRHK